MQIGFVGLGKMGGNMVHRIERDSDHEVVAFDPNPDAVNAAEGHGAIGASSLEELVSKLQPPRMVWLMVPSGKITEGTITAARRAARRGRHDRRRRQLELARRPAALGGARAARASTTPTSARPAASGAWTIGYCMMAGGPDESIQQLAPILDVLAPPDGWRHFGPAGAGHFVKMVHNGVEYGMMQAYAEGFDLMHKADFPIELKEVAGLWNRGSVVRSWLCELAERAFEQEGNDLGSLQGYVDDSGEGRWMMADGIEMAVPTPALAASLYARFYSRKEGDYAARVLAALRNQFGGHAVKKVEETWMAVDIKPDPQAHGENPLIEGLERLPVPATTLTIFGATGDLAHRKLLPALYNLAHEGALPERFNLIGVSRREMPDDEFREMARGAIEKYSRRETDPTVLEGLLGRMHYVGLLVRRRAELREARAGDRRSSTRRAAASSTAPSTSRPRPSTSR